MIALDTRPFYQGIETAKQAGMLALGKTRVSGIWPKSWLLRQERKSRSLRERYGENSGMESKNASKASDVKILKRALCMFGKGRKGAFRARCLMPGLQDR